MKAHKVVQPQEVKSSGKISKGPKINNSIFGIVSIFAIVLIVLFVVKDTNKNSQVTLTRDTIDTSGQVSEVLLANLQNVPFCKLIVGQTTTYDETTLATILTTGVSTYYSGYSVTVKEINTDGCLVDINGNSEYLAIGQIQKIGSLYVTVRDVVQ